MTFFLALLFTLAVATSTPIDGPNGWTQTTGASGRVVGVWISPESDPDLVAKFRASVSLLSAASNIAGEEKTRDKQIAQLGGTLERDQPVRCGQNDGRWIEYVLTKPSTIDSVVLMIEKSPTQLLLATYSRPVGTNAAPAVIAWFQRLCTDPAISTT